MAEKESGETAPGESRQESVFHATQKRVLEKGFAGLEGAEIIATPETDPREVTMLGAYVVLGELYRVMKPEINDPERQATARWWERHGSKILPHCGWAAGNPLMQTALSRIAQIYEQGGDISRVLGLGHVRSGKTNTMRAFCEAINSTPQLPLWFVHYELNSTDWGRELVIARNTGRSFNKEKVLEAMKEELREGWMPEIDEEYSEVKPRRQHEIPVVGVWADEFVWLDPKDYQTYLDLFAQAFADEAQGRFRLGAQWACLPLRLGEKTPEYVTQVYEQIERGLEAFVWPHKWRFDVQYLRYLKEGLGDKYHENDLGGLIQYYLMAMGNPFFIDDTTASLNSAHGGRGQEIAINTQKIGDFARRVNEKGIKIDRIKPAKGAVGGNFHVSMVSFPDVTITRDTPTGSEEIPVLGLSKSFKTAFGSFPQDEFIASLVETDTARARIMDMLLPKLSGEEVMKIMNTYGQTGQEYTWNIVGDQRS